MVALAWSLSACKTCQWLKTKLLSNSLDLNLINNVPLFSSTKDQSTNYIMLIKLHITFFSDCIVKL